tara:strand:+ start:674 stop:1783 length:1110 start_codon:yes stop_codon:yes gene_type:complete
MKNIYDFIVIGAGISGCTFASSLNKRFSDTSILLVEHGRRLGGRATTRKSRQNTILEFDHGLPSISFSKNTSKNILSFISPLINSTKLVDISNEIFLINEIGDLDNAFINFKSYRSMPFMINFCEEIINQSLNPKKINFLFQTLIKSIKRTNDLWELKVNNERSIKSKNLILSSSLIVHPRCLEILKIDYLPLRKAIIPGKDKVVDSIIRLTKKQVYLRRKTYILYVSSSKVVKNFNHRYLQIYFSNVIEEAINFERVIFQMQSDGSMIIVLHCSNINNLLEIDEIIKSLKKIFVKHQSFIDLFLQARLIDEMEWRASQPLNHLLPKELQWSSVSNVGFCGDWFDLNSFPGVETAMNSSIRLADLFNFN